MFAAFLQPFVLVLGILSITSEFRHGTITPSLLVTPDRVRLVLAKLGASVLVGLVLGLVTSVLIFLIVKGIGGARDLDTSGDGGKVIIGTTVGTALWGALGLGVGSILRNQVGAIVGILIYGFILEDLIGLIPGIRDVLPKYGLGGVSNSLAGVGDAITDEEMLSQPVAGLLLALYVLVIWAIGLLVMRRRDVTA